MNTPSLLDQIDFFLATRNDSDYLILFSIILIIVICFLARFIRKYSAQKVLRKQRKLVHDILERAHVQNGNFDLQIGDRVNKINYSAMLTSITSDKLIFNILDHVNNSILGSHAEFYFSLRLQGKVNFFKFRVPIIDLKYEHRVSTLTVAKPDNLDVGQKRNFFRITPIPNSVKLLAVWLLDPTKPLPKTTGEVGSPLMSRAFPNNVIPKENENILRVVDISASGIAIHIPYKENIDPLFVKDAQILCLLIYNESFGEEESLVNFCATANITNVRPASKGSPNKIVGMEFTNWAILESANSTITWFHQAKATGIGPILQWVTRMDIETRKGSALDSSTLIDRE